MQILFRTNKIALSMCKFLEPIKLLYCIQIYTICHMQSQNTFHFTLCMLTKITAALTTVHCLHSVCCPFSFQNCLTTIYLSFLSGNTKSLEGLVGCILGFVQVPPPGGPKMTFSMGAGDRQTLSPPVSETLPVTGKSVAILFNQLGKLLITVNN